MASTNAVTGSVVGYFSSEDQALEAVQALQSAGFASDTIGVALSNAGSPSADYASTPQGTRSTAGAKTENAWDRFKGMFGVGESTGNVEPYADEKVRNPGASHEITTPDSYDYEHEDVAHSLSGMSVPEDRARYFGHRLGSSQGAVVTVQAPGREAEAEQILASYGGDTGGGAADYSYEATPAAETTGGQQRIQLLGEVLRVHKDRISRGEVRIRKETVTEQQTIQVPVSREELVIERMPVSGETPVQGEIGSSEAIRIPLTEERASLDTQTVVREQVNIGKRSVEDVENLEGSVRHEELDIEDETKRR